MRPATRPSSSAVIFTATVSVNAPSETYNAKPYSLATATVTGLNGATITDGSVTFTYFVHGSLTPLSSAPTNAGTYDVQASFSGDALYAPASRTATFTIGQAAPTVVATDAGGTYTSDPFTAAATVTGVGSDGILASSTIDSGTLTFSYYAGSSVSGSPLSGAPINPGVYTVVAHYTSDNANYSNADSAPVTFTITPVEVTISGDVFVLNQTASGALTVSGNAEFNVAGTLQVDSNSASAVMLSGNAEVNAAQTAIVGGDRISGNAYFKHTPTTGAAFVANPLADLPAPTGGTSYAAVNLAGNSTLTINPGDYPSITVSGNAHLILNPGVYIIGSGGVTISGSASVTSGQGVLIYNNGVLTLSGNAKLDITAYSTGIYAGLGIFQATTDASAVTVSGNANLNLNGSFLYDANVQSTVTFSGNGTVEASLVVNELTISENSDDND